MEGQMRAPGGIDEGAADAQISHQGVETVESHWDYLTIICQCQIKPS